MVVRLALKRVLRVLRGVPLLKIPPLMEMLVEESILRAILREVLFKEPMSYRVRLRVILQKRWRLSVLTVLAHSIFLKTTIDVITLIQITATEQ